LTRTFRDCIHNSIHGKPLPYGDKLNQKIIHSQSVSGMKSQTPGTPR
jgi:hypothetical protein